MVMSMPDVKVSASVDVCIGGIPTSTFIASRIDVLAYVFDTLRAMD